MFDNNHNRTRIRGGHRGRRGEMRDALRGEGGHRLREELRRSFRPGAGNQEFSFRDLFGQGRPRPIVRRGEVRGLILATLRERPMHGYEVIQELEAQSDGRWRPSAGSVYPTLQLLSDEGLLTSSEVEGRRTYALTESGRIAANEAAEAAPRSRWADAEDSEPDIRRSIVELASAAIQVHRMGSPATKREASRILGDARKQVYRLLSDDEGEIVGTEPVKAPTD